MSINFITTRRSDKTAEYNIITTGGEPDLTPVFVTPVATHTVIKGSLSTREMNLPDIKSDQVDDLIFAT